MIHNVTLLWGDNFQNVLPLLAADSNGKFPYYTSSSAEVLGGPEQDVFVAEPRYSLPYDIGSKIKSRLFSLTVTINTYAELANTPGDGALYGWQFHQRRGELLRALYSGPVRIVFLRWHPTIMTTMPVYIEGRVESSPEGAQGVFSIKLVAANPYYTQASVNMAADVADWNVSGAVQTAINVAASDPGKTLAEDWMALSNLIDFNTGNPISDAMSYGASQTSYVGTAPVEPVVTFEVGGNGNVFRYFKMFQVSNPSSVALASHPICVDLGDVSALVSGGLMRSDYGDIRLETLYGTAKTIYVRPNPNHTTGPSVKVWFVMHSLQPGEVKTFRLFYGSTSSTAETENFFIKPMFTMYDSTNAQWIYNDFFPGMHQPQSRIAQWTPFLENNQNITWLAYSNSSFAPPSDSSLVAQAGAKTRFYGQGAGYAGVMLASNLAISSIVYPYRTRTSFKCPFVQRSFRSGGLWIDDFVAANTTGGRDTLTTTALAGTSSINVQNPLGSGYTTGDYVHIPQGPGHTQDFAWVSTVDHTTYSTITFTGTTADQVDAGTYIYQNWDGRLYSANTVTFPVGDEPRSIAATFRVDRPDLTLGDWYFAGMETCTVNFLSSEVPLVRWRVTSPTGDYTSATFSGGYLFDLNNFANGYQLKGRVLNSYDDKGVGINFVLKHLHDRLVLDCERHLCLYYEWDAATSAYLDPVDVYAALTFEEIRDYWLRFLPVDDAQEIYFPRDPHSNFRNLRVTVTWKNRFL